MVGTALRGIFPNQMAPSAMSARPQPQTRGGSSLEYRRVGTSAALGKSDTSVPKGVFQRINYLMSKSQFLKSYHNRLS